MSWLGRLGLFAFILAACLAAATNAPVVLAQGESAVPPDQLSETYRDWVVRCQRADGSDDPEDRSCEMVQQLTTASSGQMVLQLRLTPPDANGAHVGILLVPLGILVQHPITLSVDDETLIEAPVSSCIQTGCIAPFTVGEREWATLRSGQTLSVQLANGNTREIYEAALSLFGFSAASDRLAELSPVAN